MDEISKRVESLSPLKRALYEIEELQSELKRIRSEREEKIAVIGMECRFPAAGNVDKFWKVLSDGTDAISEVPKNRWDMEDKLEVPELPGKTIPRFGGFIEDADKFDAQFFGISPREAMNMDPQQRLLLEVVWHALENSNINPEGIVKSSTGVFIGISSNDYTLVQDRKVKNHEIDAYHGIGNAMSIAANRISYMLDLQGPSLALDTACSSSLVAVHLACQSLRSGESALAIAGGVSLMFSPIPTITFSLANLLAPGGRCRTFDASAEGYVRGEGCGVVILKKLSDAIKDKNNILAIIGGSAVNQDGRTNGLTAPNSLAQKMVINEALVKAKTKAEEIGYIEAHGTGTIIGDPIEVQALSEVMKDRSKDNPCYLGSVKTNIGHLEAASGMASLIKTILILKNKKIPAHLHFKKANPHIHLDELPFKIPTQLIEWKYVDNKRKAGVNSFGFGGTNAHIILEESLENIKPENIKEENNPEISSAKDNNQVLCLSAKTENALRRLIESYISFIAENPEISLSEICFSANTSRKAFQYRISVPAENKEELIDSLRKYISNDSGFAISCCESLPAGKTVFLFTGLEEQNRTIIKSFYYSNPVFKSILDKSSEMLRLLTGESLVDIIFENISKESLIRKPIFSQPADYSVKYALAKLWISWGIKPNYLFGYGIGELAAAALANVFSFEDGLRLSYFRGLFMESQPGGSGLEEFKQRAQSIKYNAPEIPLFASLTGKPFESGMIADAAYWSAQINAENKFNQGIEKLIEPGANTLIEIGLNYSHALSRLFTGGFSINWKELYKHSEQKKIQLPVYPFQKERYWFEDLLKNEEAKESQSESNNGGYIRNETEQPAETNPGENNKSVDKNGDRFLEKEEFNGLNNEDRKCWVQSFLKAELSKILRVKINDISSSQSIIYLGLDSITAIELKNKIEIRLGIEIPAAFLIKGPALSEITDYLTGQLDKQKTEEMQADEKAGKEITSVESRPGISILSEFPLSHGQAAMWYQHQLSPESIFNPSYAVKIKSAIDIEKLRKAVSIILKRHPLLRATIHYRDGKLFQKIEESIKDILSVEFIGAEDSSSILKRINEEASKHIDIEKGPLFRIHVLSTSDKEHYIIMVSHHIITDIWSQAVILNELSILYSSEIKEIPLDSLCGSYYDYITNQNSMLNAQTGSEHWEYWKNKLSGKLPVLNFPTDRPRPPVQTYRGNIKSVFMGEKLTEELHKLSKHLGVTSFAALLAAFKILLYRYTGESDLIVGSPFAGRTKKEFYRTVGYFVNPLPLRSYVSGSRRFSDLLIDIKQTILDAIAHQDYPIELLIEKLNPVRETGRTPLFQVMFVYQHAHLMDEEGLTGLSLGMEGNRLSFAGLNMESVKIDEQVSPFDITMMMAESEGNLALTLTYNTELFEDDTIERLITHYRNILCNICKVPDQLIKDINILSSTELENIRSLNSPKKQIQNSCIHTLFEKQVLLTPNETALVFNSQSVSYKELNHISNRIAHYLIRSGIEREDIIAIDFERSIEMIAAMLGILKSGAAYLPLDYSAPKARKQMIIKDSRAKITLVKNKEEVLPENSELNCISIEEILSNDEVNEDKINAEENPQILLDPDNLVYVIYTSGSTGKPKGVQVNHKGLVNTIFSLIDKYDVYKKSRVIQFASPAFDASAQEIYMTLLTGGTLYLIEQDMVYSVTKLTDYMEEQKITHVTLPPSLLSILSEDKLSTLHTIVSAGEACTKEIARKWTKDHLFVNAYGPTEASICSSTYLVKSPVEAMNVPIGYPIDNAKMYICDADINLMPAGAIGEIMIGGKGLARGYQFDPEMTAEKFIPDPFSNVPGARLYRTGDLAKMHNDGSIEFTGRKDYQLKIRGNRIEAEEIEKVIKSYPGVKDAVIVTNKTSDAIYAYYLSEDLEVTENSGQTEPADLSAALSDYLRQHLPNYMIPSMTIKLKEFPHTINGKVDRKVLSGYKIQSGNIVDQKVKPQTEVEKIIADIWEEVLNVNSFGIHDNFFDVGGHSLAAAKVQMKLQQKFGCEVSIVDLFNYPSIQSLAKYISSGNNHKVLTDNIQSRVEKQKAMVNLQRHKTISKRSS